MLSSSSTQFVVVLFRILYISVLFKLLLLGAFCSVFVYPTVLHPVLSGSVLFSILHSSVLFKTFPLGAFC